MPTTDTPIRYPGGKTKIYPLVRSIIKDNDYKSYTYVEPFAGGAGLAIRLLVRGHVSSIVINDFDRAVYCIWDTIVNHGEDLCTFIDKTPLTVEEWRSQREVYQNQEDASNFDLGKAAFYLNRTNVSGILNGGVIGGLEQKGKYKIDARFNKDGLK